MIPRHPSLGHKLNRVRHFNAADPEKFTSLMKMLFKEQREKKAASDEAIQSLFRLLLIELCRTASVLSGEKVKEYLDVNFTDPIHLRELCELSKLKASNLCRRFKDYTGMSTGDYLKKRRLAAALQRLRRSDDKILGICNDCGFSEISRFNRYFREDTGCTPSEYRKRFSGE